MTANKKTIELMPKYMKEFKCIGANCEDSCCAGWQVNIDRETYQKYKNCRQAELKVDFKENIKRNRKNPSQNNYASMVLDELGNCKFLTEEKLCSIYTQLGEEFLSVACTKYPRNYNIVNGTVEKSATVSCPEVVRQALLNPEKMEFEYVEVYDNIENINIRTINNSSLELKDNVEKYFWELRSFTIQVLQIREYKLWERLIILGIFYQTVQEYIDNKVIDEIPSLINEYICGMENGIFDATLDEVPNNASVQIELLHCIMNKRIKAGLISIRYVECFNKFVKGIKTDNETSQKEVAENYINAYEQYYSKFMESHQYLLENYLVNYVFKNLFPFSVGKDLFENYAVMVIHYSLIKMQLIGMMAYYKADFKIEHSIKLIQSFAKTIEHDNVFISDILVFLKESGFVTLSHMLLLIKDE